MIQRNLSQGQICPIHLNHLQKLDIFQRNTYDNATADEIFFSFPNAMIFLDFSCINKNKTLFCCEYKSIDEEMKLQYNGR